MVGGGSVRSESGCTAKEGEGDRRKSVSFPVMSVMSVAGGVVSLLEMFSSASQHSLLHWDLSSYCLAILCATGRPQRCLFLEIGVL